MKKQHWTKALIKSLLPLAGCSVLAFSTVACSLEIKPDPEVDTTITILYDPNGGTIEGSSQPKPLQTKRGTIWKDVVKPEVINPGMIVDYWMDSSHNPIPDDTIFNSDTTVFAHWVEDPTTKYSITFHIEPTLDEEITWGSDTEWVAKHSRFVTANSPVVVRTNYIFNGWSYSRGGAPIDPSETVDGNIDVYPLWTQDIGEESKIIAHLNDGDYVCDIDTLCTANLSTQIHIEKIGDPSTQHDYNRDVFDFPLTIGSDILYLPNYFLYGCSGFNSQIDFAANPKLTYIGQSCMSNCTSFNQQILLPNTLKCIYNDFFGGCIAFNNGNDGATSFTIPDSVQVIGQDFFNGCESFNRDIEITQYIDFLGQNCMFNCRNFTSTLYINTGIENIEYGMGSAWASDSSSDLIYTEGFSVDGNPEYVQYFKATYPTSLPGSDFWRKIKE